MLIKKIKTCIYRIIHGLLTIYKLRSIWILKMTTPHFKPLNLRVLASNTAKKQIYMVVYDLQMQNIL